MRTRLRSAAAAITVKLGPTGETAWSRRLSGTTTRLGERVDDMDVGMTLKLTVPLE